MIKYFYNVLLYLLFIFITRIINYKISLIIVIILIVLYKTVNYILLQLKKKLYYSKIYNTSLSLLYWKLINLKIIAGMLNIYKLFKIVIIYCAKTAFFEGRLILKTFQTLS